MRLFLLVWKKKKHVHGLINVQCYSKCLKMTSSDWYSQGIPKWSVPTMVRTYVEIRFYCPFKRVILSIFVTSKDTFRTKFLQNNPINLLDINGSYSTTYLEQPLTELFRKVKIIVQQKFNIGFSLSQNGNRA